jgi:hypothetical protein
MVRDWCERYKYAIFFYVFLIIYASYSIVKAYGFSYLPDEFGYWAYAAKASGYDWSGIVSLGSYYSYGYSLFLFPIFKIFNNSVIAYRAAVGINFLLIGIAYMIVVHIGRKYVGMKNDECYIVAAIAMCYPSILFFGKSTMAEVLLSVVYIIICAFMYAYIQSGKLYTLAFLLLGLIYIYFVHMRTVGVLVAGILTLLIYHVKKNRNFKHVLIMIAILVAVLAIGYVIKNTWLMIIYNGNNTMADANDYMGQINKIKFIFTTDGIKNFATSIAGKLLNMGLSTLGLAWFGLAYLIKAIFRHNDTKYKIVYAFIILSVIAEILINAIFNVRAGRVDSVIYGRYHEFVFPILILYGVYEIRHIGNRTKILSMSIMSVVNACFTYLVTVYIKKYGITSFYGCFVVGMGYLYNQDNFEPVSFMWQTYIFATVVSVIIIAMVTIFKTKGKRAIATIIVIAEICVSLRASSIYIDSSALGNFRDVAVVSKIQNLLNSQNSDNTNRKIIYITDDNSYYVCVLQFMMRDAEITLLPSRDSIEQYTDEELNENDILVLNYKSSFTEEAAKKYTSYFLNGHFYVFYNV